MILFFVLSLLIFLFTHNNALQCVNYTNPWTFTIHELMEAKEFANNLQTIDGYENCTILLDILYSPPVFLVKFNTGIDESIIDVNTDVLIFTTIRLASGNKTLIPASSRRVFTFACNEKDACERQFFFDHIDWLTKEEFTMLESALRSTLLCATAANGECIVQDEDDTGTCSSHGCIAVYDSQLNQTLGGCVDENELRTEVQFLTEVSFSTNDNGKEDDDRNLIITQSVLLYGYWCQFNFCNHQAIEKVVRNVITDQFNLSSIHEILRNKFQQKQIAESITRFPNNLITSNAHTISTFVNNPTSANSSISTENSTTSQPPSVLHYISMNIFIFYILFLLFFSIEVIE